MLTISREVPVKIGRHAWNVFPLEAFGYLLGRTAEKEVLVALPCSKTRQWHDFSDRWNGIDENFEKAGRIAAQYKLEITGFYASNENFPSEGRPKPESTLLNRTAMGLLVIYTTQCCPRCSYISVIHQGQRLEKGSGFIVPPGKRAVREINQRRVYQAWLGVMGHIDYSNGYQE